MKHLFPSVRIYIFLTLVTGIIYPVAVTVLGGWIFNANSGGGILYRNGQPIGAKIIAQKFVSEKYFWGRPSSVDYNPLPSGGSNLGPTSAALKTAVQLRIDNLKKASPITDVNKIPQDLIFASASGLDPEISPEAAEFQVERIAKARGLSETQKQNLAKLIRTKTQPPDLGFLGNPRVNILALNLALDDQLSR